MKHTILTYLLFALWQIAHAQSYLLPTAYASQQGSHWSEIAPALSIQNTTARSVDIRWEINRTNLPAGWTVQVCDKNCHGADAKGTFTLAAHETLANLRVAFVPNGAEGIGSIEIKLQEVGSRQESTLTFTAAAQNTLSTQADKFSKQMSAQRLYPNPAIDHIMLQDDDNVVRMIEIYNIVGRKVLEYPVLSDNDKYDVSALPRGMYMVRLLDSHRQIIRTQRISKYNP